MLEIVGQVLRMAPPRKNSRFRLAQLAARRKARKLTQEALAARVGLTQGMISHLETGETDFTGTHMVMLSGVLECAPPDLLAYPPGHPMEIFHSLPPQAQVQAVELMKALKRTS